MKRLASVLAALALLSGCASAHHQPVTMAGIHGSGRAVGTQGSTSARSSDVLALNERDRGDNTGREPRGIPTPQPVREGAMAAHSIPVPQPPIPMPNRASSYSARWP